MDLVKARAVVATALAAQTGATPEEITPDQQLAMIPGIESVRILRAVVRIEDEFDIAIPDDFLFETATVQQLVELVAKLVEKGRR